MNLGFNFLFIFESNLRKLFANALLIEVYSGFANVFGMLFLLSIMNKRRNIKMKKILFGLSVFFTTLMSAQIYQDYYPTSDNSAGYSDVYDDEFYFPDDYYYEYPADYYSNDLYRSYYDDYRRSIYDVNWNRFFSAYQLAPWQIQQIMMLNDQFRSYSAWNSYYRYNPDRWYYDRFYSLERILGPRIFVIFQNNYYNGYNPVVYYQNYRRQHYVPHVYVVPRYRNININRYRVDRVKYHQTNPRQNIGFRDNPRTANSNGNIAPRADGFREGAQKSGSTQGFRNEGDGVVRSAPRVQNGGLRSPEVKPQAESPKSNSGLRNDRSEIRNSAPQRRIENNSPSPRNQTPGLRTPAASARTSGQRLTSR
ncbi:hypothetical protein FIC_00400 [Flavobacteriaceae bacterium 3519-10]|nr:hypothetical protein FIC_00400 [Flavobacteriaceae bacterium 3519-10]